MPFRQVNSILISQHDQTGELRPLRRHFVRTQYIKGVSGLFLTLFYLSIADSVDWVEFVALAGLIVPIAFALLGRVPIRLRYLESVAVSLAAIVITYLSAMTGGLASPFLVWLMLVPFEGALSRRWSTVLFAGFAAVFALAAVSLMQFGEVLPPSRVDGSSLFGHGLVFFLAVCQAVFQAIATQEHKRVADAAVAAGEARYQFLTEHAMDLITSHRPDGGISSASPASIGLLGITPEAMIGENFLKFVHPADRERVVTGFEALRSNGGLMDIELRLRRSDGESVWTELRCRAVGGRPGGDGELVAVTRDITERKANELQLVEARDLAEDASRAKSRFLANMSHELRTPLNAIIGFSEIMTREMFGPVGSARYMEYSRLINESGNHLLELINAILDMSKIEANKYALAKEMFSLDEVVSQSLRFVKFVAERSSISLAEGLTLGDRQIYADKRAVMQILINLLSNGIKFTPKGGTVRVDAVSNDGGIELSVSDNGIGISEENLKRLGNPFEQVENEMTRTKEGTGLGLALVRALAELHGGTIRVESDVGKGTTVRVFFPQAEAFAQAEPVALRA